MKENYAILLHVLGSFYGIISDRIGLEARGNYSVAIRYNVFCFRFAHGKHSKPIHSYDFGMLGRFHDSQNQYHALMETEGYLAKTNRVPNRFLEIYVGNLRLWEIKNCKNVGKMGTKNHKGPT